MNSRQRLGAAILILLVLVIGGSILQLWTGGGFIALAFASLSVTEVVARMTPLFVTAAFIERAVEVVVTPWRDSDANQLELRLKEAHPIQVPGLRIALNDYKSTTQGIAFMIALIMGVLVSLIGVRGIEAFLEPDFWKNVMKESPPPAVMLQYHLFTVVDVLITGALLAGGADGIHKVTSLITDFLNSTRDKVNGSPGASPPASMAGTPADAGTALPGTPASLPAPNHIADSGA